MKRHRQSRRRGFLLLEVILALAVFSMAATGFVVALQRMSKVASAAHAELRVTRILDGAMNELLSLPVLEVGESRYAVEGTEVEILTSIELVEDLQNQDGVALDEIYRLRITARWFENGTWQDRKVETWRHGRMYQP